MNIEELTEEIEDWLEKADEEETLKFLKYPLDENLEGAIIIELLGHYGTVAQSVAKKLLSTAKDHKKLAGIFSIYFTEMVQLRAGSILLPISLVKVRIGTTNFIITTTSFPIPDVVSYQLAEELLLFYNKLKPSKIILIDGVHSYNRDIATTPMVHHITSLQPDINRNDDEKSNFTMMGQVASSLLTYHLNTEDIPIELLLVDSFAESDPISSLEVLTVLNREYGDILDLSDLKDEASNFKNNFIKFNDKPSSIKEVLTSESQFFV
ncbi:MAG: PAC2 family protein [Candidatus Heimdallarchaeota archaeon]|nr:PAC2 family protein [Candidatus Heimdallarchaeota archaeon]